MTISKNIQNKDLIDTGLLNEDKKVLQNALLEHSAILLTCIRR